MNRFWENQTKYSITLENITTAIFYFNKICTAAPSIQGYAVQRSFPMTKYSKKREEGMVLWTLDHTDLCAKVLCNPVSLKKLEIQCIYTLYQPLINVLPPSNETRNLTIRKGTFIMIQLLKMTLRYLHTKSNYYFVDLGMFKNNVSSSFQASVYNSGFHCQNCYLCLSVMK